MILLKGKCKVISNIDGFVICFLSRGDIIGDSDLLKISVIIL
jgi:hypothetical protein